MEDFIDTLDKEASEYEVLLDISKRKTPILVKGDVAVLSKITEEEQVVVDRINNIDRHRVEVLTDIATVLNKDVQTLRVPELIKILEKQPKEREKLSATYVRLKAVIDEMKLINDQNRKLVELSLDMINFDINLLESMKKGPETGDYNKRGGYRNEGIIAGGASRFDSKS